jgi:(1->4)-alpha-D-glucan 1-alpha-D-glucosylmutase
LPDVFDHAHRLVFRLLRNGTLDGLRIDHIDGLLDPKAYLQQLRDKAGSDFYLIVEKILARHESLREDWPIQGTTGYDVTNLLLGLMVDPAGEEAFTASYIAFTGRAEPFLDIVRDCKLRIMDNEMASELNVLARDAGRVARETSRTTDFTRNILHRAIRAIIACFPVYRTYIDVHVRPTQADRRDLDWAVAQSRRLEPDLDPSVFDFLARLLAGDLVAQPRSGFSRHSVLRCAMKAQQYSGPVMAKGLEDTAFYRYNRFIALNEVGGNPDQFGISLASFHRANRQRAQNFPQSMLSTSTHDTKRGEDARARLAVLSELGDEWTQRVQVWNRLLRARRGDIEGAGGPDRNDEYAFFQTLIGSWPIELLDHDDLDPGALVAYGKRLKGALVKSMREAKQYTIWAMPDERYEATMLDLADLVLDPARSGTFLTEFLPFVANVARLGAANTLVQTILKLTLPGVPDIYQGTELWDLSLVDPDNRRPVDYDLRSSLLNETEVALSTDRVQAMQRYMHDWRDGRFKLAAMATLLRLRRSLPTLFENGDYDPLTTSDDTCAFVRRQSCI